MQDPQHETNSAGIPVIAEDRGLREYTANWFEHSKLFFPLVLPPEPDLHIARWQKYATEAKLCGAFSALSRYLVQFRFPIQAGISKTEYYRLVTLEGISPESILQATGLKLNYPEQLRLQIYSSIAGLVPVIIPYGRDDYVTVLRALAFRNEPVEILDSQGAAMLRGFNNWDRIAALRSKWEETCSAENSSSSWEEEFQRIIPQRELYQDKFIIVSDGPYSGIRASEMGIEEQEWTRMSLAIRLEHECSHYFTYKLGLCRQKCIMDEIIADFAGMVAVSASFRADWFLRFWGLESYPVYREGGRLELYCSPSELSSDDYRTLMQMIIAAAENLERRTLQNPVSGRLEQIETVLALTYLSLPELAESESPARLGKIIDDLKTKIQFDAIADQSKSVLFPKT